MSSNYMLLKSCRVSKKAKAVTSSTPVKEKAKSVVHSCLNDRHGSAKDCQKIENAEFLISNLQSFTFMALFYGWDSNASRLQSHYEEAINFLPISFQKLLVLI